MKKLDLVSIENIKAGASGWDYYAASCGISLSLLNISFAAGPIAFGANAIYTSVCGLLLPIAKASGY